MVMCKACFREKRADVFFVCGGSFEMKMIWSNECMNLVGFLLLKGT